MPPNDKSRIPVSPAFLKALLPRGDNATIISFMTIVVLSVGWLASIAAMAGQTASNGGLYVLHSAYAPDLDPELLKRSYIQGAALQIGWRDVEPQEGRYQWDRIDALIALAQREKKLVTIHILPLRPPEWLFRAGAQEFTFTNNFRESPQYGRTVREVVAWDPVYLARWANMVKQFGARYNIHAGVFAVSVTAPMPEMVLPGSFPRNTEAYQRISRMYDRSAYLAAWKQMINAYQDAFPDKYKILAPGIVFDDYRFGDEVLQYAYQKFGKRLVVFNAGLRAVLPTAFPPMEHIYSLLKEFGQKSNLGFQTIWSSTNDPGNRMRGSLKEALSHAVKLGAGYVEVYEVDVKNPALQADLLWASGALPGMH